MQCVAQPQPTLPPPAHPEPHLCDPVHGGSSHPSPPSGLGCPGHQGPAARSCFLSLGGSQEVGGLTGGAAAGPGDHAWHGRGAVPGVVAAAMKLVVSHDRSGRAEDGSPLPLPLAPPLISDRETCAPPPPPPSPHTCPLSPHAHLAKQNLLMDCNVEDLCLPSSSPSSSFRTVSHARFQAQDK